MMVTFKLNFFLLVILFSLQFIILRSQNNSEGNYTLKLASIEPIPKGTTIHNISIGGIYSGVLESKSLYLPSYNFNSGFGITYVVKAASFPDRNNYIYSDSKKRKYYNTEFPLNFYNCYSYYINYSRYYSKYEKTEILNNSNEIISKNNYVNINRHILSLGLDKQIAYYGDFIFSLGTGLSYDIGSSKYLIDSYLTTNKSSNLAIENYKQIDTNKYFHSVENNRITSFTVGFGIEYAIPTFRDMKSNQVSIYDILSFNLNINYIQQLNNNENSRLRSGFEARFSVSYPLPIYH